MSNKPDNHNPLNENKEVQDVIYREIDLEEGVIINVSEEVLHKSKDKCKSKKTIFKDVHKVHHYSTFVDIDKVQDIILDNTSIEFCNEALDQPIETYQEPTLDLDDFMNLLELEKIKDQEDKE